VNLQIHNSIDFFRKVPKGIREIKRLNLSTLRKVFSLMGKYERIIFSFLIITAILSAWLFAKGFYNDHTVLAPTYGGTYREGMVGQPRLINPVLATSTVDNSLVRLIYSGLYTYNEKGELIPDLAVDQPKISEDQKEYTVTIRPNAKFHNDRSVTADDIIYTIKTIQDPSFKSPLRSDWLNTTVEKVSENEVRFKNKNVSAPFLNNLTLSILPSRIWNQTSADNFQLSDLNLKPIGSGPYLIREINKLPSGDVQRITLESYKDYTGGKAFIDRIVIVFYENLDSVYKAYKSGEVSGFAYIPYTQNAEVEEKINMNNSSEYIPLPQYQALFFNVDNKVLSDKQIRKALRQVVPKKEIISKAFDGQAKEINTPILPEQIGYKFIPEPISDLTSANSLLDSLGYTVNENGIRSKKGQLLEFTIVTNDTPINVKTAELVANEWKKLNVKINVSTMPTRELTENFIRPRSFDVLIFGQKSLADPDPFAYWHSSQIKDPGLNVSGFANSEVDSLITEARSTILPEIRQDRYERFLEILDEESPAVFLNQGVLVYLTNSEIHRVNSSGLYDISYRFDQISKWHIKEKRVLK